VQVVRSRFLPFVYGVIYGVIRGVIQFSFGVIAGITGGLIRLMGRPPPLDF